MYTQCPNCSVIFAMAEEDLDAHQGLVRCGRCREVFNASWNLVDNIPGLQSAAVEDLHVDEQTTGENIQIGIDELELDEGALFDEASAGYDGHAEPLVAEQNLLAEQEEADRQDASAYTADLGGGEEALSGENKDAGEDLEADDGGLISVHRDDALYEDRAEEWLAADEEAGVETMAEETGPGEVAVDVPSPAGGLEHAAQTEADDMEPAAAAVEQESEHERVTDADADPVQQDADEAGPSLDEMMIEDVNASSVPEAAADEAYAAVEGGENSPIQPEDISAEEEVAMDELSALLEGEEGGDEVVLVPEDVAVDDLESVPPPNSEIGLESPATSDLTEASPEDTAEASDLVAPEALVSPDDQVVVEHLNSMVEQGGVDDATLSDSGEAVPGLESDAAGEPAGNDERKPSSLTASFPDVEPEEIVIEAPTRLWRLDEDSADAIEGAPSQADAAQTGSTPALPRPRAGISRIPYSVRLTSWFLGSILLLAALVWQVKQHYLEDMAQVPSLREPLKQACRYLRCTVPPRSDIKAIDLVGTNVDPHPVSPGALRVSANLINRANFVQQFPPLEITLTDKEGKVVGRRTYFPHEYRGDAPNRMLPNVLVRADFDLAQPAETAVGYEIQLVVR